MSARNMLHGDLDKVAFTINALKDYNPVYGNHSTPVQQPRFTLFGKITKVPKSKVVIYLFLSGKKYAHLYCVAF